MQLRGNGDLVQVQEKIIVRCACVRNDIKNYGATRRIIEIKHRVHKSRYCAEEGTLMLHKFYCSSSNTLMANEQATYGKCIATLSVRLFVRHPWFDVRSS